MVEVARDRYINRTMAFDVFLTDITGKHKHGPVIRYY